MNILYSGAVILAILLAISIVYLMGLIFVLFLWRVVETEKEQDDNQVKRKKNKKRSKKKKKKRKKPRKKSRRKKRKK